MLNDALCGILFRDINIQRTLVDQYMSRVISGFAGVIINTGEDNYLTTADAVEEAHGAGFRPDQRTTGPAVGLPRSKWVWDTPSRWIRCSKTASSTSWRRRKDDPARSSPKAPLKYMPPTKFMTGNIFRGHIQDALFNMVGIWTSQGIQLLGMPTEAIHTPFMSDRYLSIENAR